MATGDLGYMALSIQNSFGTATQSWHYLPFVSETLVHQMDRLTIEGIRASLVEAGVVAGITRAAGDIVVEPDPNNIGYFLRSVFGQSSSETINHTFNFRLADWSQKSPLPAYSVLIHRGADEAFQFQDVIFPRMQLDIAANALARATFAALGRVTTLTSVNISSATAAYIEHTPWSWAVASVSIGGVSPEYFESLSFVAENPCEGLPMLNASTLWAKFGRSGRPNVRVNGRVDLENLNEYKRFSAQSVTNLTVYLDTMVAGGPEMKIVIPSFYYDSFPVSVRGSGRVTVDFAGRGIYNAGSGTAMTITLINSYPDYND